MKSVWCEGNCFEKRESLKKDISVDTVIIGAGISGILTAYMLQKNGIDVIVLEADRICSGQTKNTTAKITSQHGVIYSKIEKYYGTTAARQYAAANENAIAQYKQIIEGNSIACDFSEQRAYLYSNDIGIINDEYLSAKKAGIDCYVEDEIVTSFHKGPALVFNNQAQFDPLKFIGVIAKDIKIYEKSPVTRIINSTVYTNQARVTAKHIVVATHYPFVTLPSMYFLRMSQQRSYAIAFKSNKKISGMYIGTDKSSLSIRGYGDKIILGGQCHRTGVDISTDPFDALCRKTKQLFPECEITDKWSAQDCITTDGLPYIGRFNDKSDNIYIATGFNKWGMTTSMVAAKIISDMICDKNINAYEIFSPSRFNLCACKKEIANNLKSTIKGYAGHIKSSNATLDKIKCGTSAEIKYNGHTAGVYKNEYGVSYVVSLTCPHLKCRLNWNNATKSWDCPCHGSRYNYKGDLLDNPAQKSSILIARIKN